MFFKKKSPRAQELAFYSALIISTLNGIINIILIGGYFGMIIFILTLIVAYFINYILIDWYIFRKIKLIYKQIYTTKTTKRENTFYEHVLPKKTLDEVNNDVEKWAARRKEEIARLKENEEYRKEFLQNLSHELKTPIFAIQGYVETLLGGAHENPLIYKRFLENASRNVGRLVRLVEDIDVIAQLESGQRSLLKENFIIQELIKDVFEELTILWQPKEIKCSIKWGCDDPVQVFADKQKIKQVVVNLVENSIKYGRNGGTIIASIYLPDDNYAIVEFSDDGIGISQEHIDRIFERFYRTDSARSRNVGGTGLGLAICKHIIEAHKQVLHVRSKPNVGTTIGFTLERRKFI